MKKVLVLGGSYFIGYNIVKNLIKDGYAVTILNRGTANPKFSGEVETILCDRKNACNMKAQLKDKHFDFVIDVSCYTASDAEAVYEALDRKSIEQYIFISSSAVYHSGQDLPLNETSDAGENIVWGDYGTDKSAAEKFFLSKHEGEGFPVVILRPPYVYGENNYVYREAFMFDRITLSRTIILPNEGKTRVQFIHVYDLYRTIEAIFGKHETIGQVYNVGDEQPVTLAEWVQCCMEVCEKHTKVVGFDYLDSGYESRDFFPLHDYEYFLNTDKIREIYTPRISMTEGLRASFSWYSDNVGSINAKSHYAVNEKDILEKYALKQLD
ncbi:MAG: NAD-dependent epimerase/dehydratase family protein [Oscillospiraceae bacterium]|jgi:nucleoside-diphosphate-sugar epimerase|nr:NAD-dependent epimerase/dehydratase family protein [Oscillospiraceae bacterium]